MAGGRSGLACRLIGHAKEFREERGIAGFAIGEQHQVMPIRHPLRRIRQQTPEQRLIAPPLHMGQYQFALRVQHLGFPGRLPS